MAGISLPIQCSSSGTKWGDNDRYPHTTRCYGLEPEVSLPDPVGATAALRTAQTAVRALAALGESSVPPYVQRFVATKKTVEGIAVGETF